MVIAIILAAGKSKRFGRNKLQEIVFGKSVLERSIEAFQSHPGIDRVFLVIASTQSALRTRRTNRHCERPNGAKQSLWFHRDYFTNLWKVRNDKLKIVIGGITRQESVWNALTQIAKNRIDQSKIVQSEIAQNKFGQNKIHQRKIFSEPIIIIHNAANPFVTKREISDCLKTLREEPEIAGVAVGRPVVNTVKEVSFKGEVIQTLRSPKLWELQTPQAVRFIPFFEAHKKAREEKVEMTDDLALLEWREEKTKVILADPQNRKITYPHDLPSFHVGEGEDSHRFLHKHLSRSDRGLRLGGVLLPKFPKLEADSDGDVVLHALASAISSAIGRGSLGTFATPLFRKKKIRDSLKYVNFILKLLERKQMTVQHVSLLIEGKVPKIDPIASQLKQKIAKILKISEDDIGITAYSGENLTPFGRGEGIRCRATVTVVKI